MQDLKIHIVIEDPKTKQDVSIRGNFEILQAFLLGIGNFEMQNLNSQNIAQSATANHKKYLLSAKSRKSKRRDLSPALANMPKKSTAMDLR